MIFDWYLVYNLTDFDALNIHSKSIPLNTEDRGLINLIITKGQYYGVNFVDDDIFLAVGINNQNPFNLGSRSVAIDTHNNLWIGLEQ